MRLSDWEQRQLDQQSGEALDRASAQRKALNRSLAPGTKAADVTTGGGGWEPDIDEPAPLSGEWPATQHPDDGSDDDETAGHGHFDDPSHAEPEGDEED